MLGHRWDRAHPDAVSADGRMGFAFSTPPAQRGIGFGRGVYEYAASVVFFHRSIISHRWIVPHGYALHYAGFEAEVAFIPETHRLGYQGIRRQFGVRDDGVKSLPGTEFPGQNQVVVAEFAQTCSGSRVSV